MQHTNSSNAHDSTIFVNTIRKISTTSENLSDKSNKSKDEFREKEEQKEKAYNEAPVQIIADLPKENEEESAKYNEIRKKILSAALEFVPAHGWTRVSIGKGAESVNYPGVIHGMFANGGVELVHYFYTDCNEKLAEILKTKESKDPSKFAKEAIQIRLQMLEPYLKTWPQAIGLMSLPQFAPKSLAIVLTLIDDICYYSGDRSVDVSDNNYCFRHVIHIHVCYTCCNTNFIFQFSWYSRRIGLATIYKMTELYMVQDTSSGFTKTWQFLEHRISDGVMLHSILDKSEGAGKNVQQAFATTFETVIFFLITVF